MRKKTKNGERKKKIIVFSIIGVLALAILTLVIVKLTANNNDDDGGNNETYCTASNNVTACQICIPEAFGDTPYYFVQGVDLKCCAEYSDGQIYCEHNIPVPSMDKLCSADCRIYDGG